MAKVAIEKEGPITVVAIDRFAEARNAVDPETAVLLRDAFLAFDADADQSVAILTGRGGAFCAGYDLKVAARPKPAADMPLYDAKGPAATTSRSPPGPSRPQTCPCTTPKARDRWDRHAICCPSP